MAIKIKSDISNTRFFFILVTGNKFPVSRNKFPVTRNVLSFTGKKSSFDRYYTPFVTGGTLPVTGSFFVTWVYVTVNAPPITRSTVCVTLRIFSVSFSRPLIGQKRECYIVKEVIEVGELDKGNISAALGKQDK